MYKSQNLVHTAAGFREHCSDLMVEELCKESCNKTMEQSNSPLWHELRYARITASKAYSVLHCKTTEGTVVEGILGAYKIKDSQAMERGPDEKQTNTVSVENSIVQDNTQILSSSSCQKEFEYKSVPITCARPHSSNANTDIRYGGDTKLQHFLFTRRAKRNLSILKKHFEKPKKQNKSSTTAKPKTETSYRF
ncbi:hypothetical protein ILUMI_06402 [Ignelater luminosus]|uniref:Uncharacterized protein n=1 Tax=Ignelater luminosus TaxID=2038154 RepID=A0A8K0DAC8_IGNLU|nr:hypothetical protein ILUMI_06402 [Ignelater luminosus]